MQKQKNILFNISFFLNGLLLFLLFFESRLSPLPWLQVFGRLHPLVVHFPIAIISIYIIAEIIMPRRYRKQTAYVNVMDMVLLLCCITGSLAALMGLFLSREDGYDEETLAIHKWTGVATAAIVFVLYIFRNPARKYAALNYVFVLLMGAGVILAGHYGGNITHGENYVLAPLIPEKKIIRASFEHAFVYADLVAPVLESKCMSCHNSKKAKGELVMETKEMLLKGGKEGLLWDTAKADLGLMMQRIHLSPEEKKHMPPTGKPQLTEEEVLILQSWIKSGADFGQRIAALPPDDTLYKIALRTLKKSTEELYDFAAADDKQIQVLSNSNRVITPLFLHSPALVVNFYNKQFYEAARITELKPVATQIVELNLNNMPVKDEDLKLIGELVNLRKLNLNNTMITGNTLADLKKLTHLKSISLSGTLIKPEQLQSLATLPELKSVHLWNTSITENDIKKLEEKNNNIAYRLGFSGDTIVLQLTPPVIENEETVITKAVPLRIKHYINGITIRYTLDGSEPDSVSSPIYIDKIMIDSAVEVKAKAYKPGWISSDIISRHFFKSGFIPDSVVLLTPPNEQYKGEGAKTLFDLVKSELNFKNGQWLGYRENEIQLKMLFQKPVEIKNIMLSGMKDVNSYIFPPSRIEVWGGMNEENLKLLNTLTPQQPLKDAVGKESSAYTCTFPATSVTCIKLVVKPVAKLPSWHAGKGEKAWVFLDEIFVN